ncbi:hypothetical protein ISCGN_027119 [Ixodes scapularis]
MLDRLRAKALAAMRLIQRVSSRRRGVREEGVLRLVQAFALSHIMYVGPYLKWWKAELNKLDAMVRKACRAGLGVLSFTHNADLDALGVHNSVTEMIEAHREAQELRLAGTAAGREILARVGVLLPLLAYCASRYNGFAFDFITMDSLPQVPVGDSRRHDDVKQATWIYDSPRFIKENPSTSTTPAAPDVKGWQFSEFSSGHGSSATAAMAYKPCFFVPQGAPKGPNLPRARLNHQDALFPRHGKATHSQTWAGEPAWLGVRGDATLQTPAFTGAVACDAMRAYPQRLVARRKRVETRSTFRSVAVRSTNQKPRNEKGRAHAQEPENPPTGSRTRAALSEA